MPTNPAASVIIPTYEGWPVLRECLAALAAQTRRDFDIIVVDNGSTDSTTTAVQREFPQIHLLPLPRNEGFVGACNAGALAARAPWLVFLNNDAAAAPQWFEQLALVLPRDPQYAAYSSKILIQADRERFDTVGSFLTPSGFLRHVGLRERDAGQYDALTEIFSPKGVAFAVRRPVFEALGGFDARYFAYYEESDLFWRIWLAGHRVGFAPRAVVYHRVSETTCRLGYATVDYHSFKNRIRTILKLAGPATLCWMLPLHLAGCIGLMGLSALWPPRWPTARAILRAVGWNLQHLDDTWRHRRTTQATRRISDRQLFQEVMQPVPVAEFLRYAWWMVVARERERARWGMT